MFNACWTPQFKELVFNGEPNLAFDLYRYVMIPIGLPIGILTGMATHTLLESVVMGVEGTPWMMGSLPVLGGIILVSGVYFNWCYTPFEDFLWIERMNPKNGESQAHNPVTKQISDNLNKSMEAYIKRNGLTALQTWYNPLKLIKPDGQQQGRKAPPLYDFTHRQLTSVNQLSQYQGLSQLIDLLLRHKFLQDCELSEYEIISSKEILTLKARDQGIKSLDDLYDQVELLIRLKRKLTRCKEVSERKMIRSNVERLKKDMIDGVDGTDATIGFTLFAMLIGRKISQDDPRITAVKSLQMNIDMFENELWSKLNVKIDDDDGKSLSAFKTDIFWRTYWMQIVGGVSGGLLYLLCLM